MDIHPENPAAVNHPHSPSPSQAGGHSSDEGPEQCTEGSEDKDLSRDLGTGFLAVLRPS